MSPSSPNNVPHAVARRALQTLAAIAAGIGMFSFIAFTLSLAFVIAGFKGDAVLPADCAMVFGAAVSGYNQPGPAILRRISTAARLYNEGSIKRLILTGGVGRGRGVSVSEASVMRSRAIAFGVRSSNIITEELSHSTSENLRNSQPLALPCKSVVGISDAYHLTRIRLLAFQMGWHNLTVLPSDERPPAVSELRSILREALAVLYYGLHIDSLTGTDPPEASAA